MISIGYYFEKMDNDLFEDKSNDRLQKCCRNYELLLKNQIDKAVKIISLHHELPGLNGKLKKWQLDRIKQNIDGLHKYVDKKIQLLDKDKILDYCKSESIELKILAARDDIVFLTCSYYGNIVYDVLWITSLPLSEMIKISDGSIDQKRLLRMIPQKIKYIEKVVLPFFQSNEDYIDFSLVLKDVVKSYKKKLFKCSSVLTILSIEGIVRTLGRELIKYQHLDLGLLEKPFNSLDNFLREIPWKSDILIDKTQLLCITGDYELFDSENTKEESLINVDLKKRLDFLRRTYKEERNAIMHGDFSGVGDSWDLFRNYSALIEVFLTIDYYNKKNNNG